MSGLRALAPGGAELAASELVAGLDLRGQTPDGRPRVVAAMIASADGRTAVEGRSVGLGHPADRALLRELRAAADVVVVGAATVRAERYANLLDADQVAHREAAGLAPRPPIAIVTRSGDVPWEVGLFAEPETEVVLYTATGVEVPAQAVAAVSVERAESPGDVLAHLHTARAARLVLCEGGPRLLRSVADAGLLDDLFLTLAPLLAAGDAPTPLAGDAFDPPRALALRDTWRADDHVFLHYAA